MLRTTFEKVVRDLDVVFEPNEGFYGYMKSFVPNHKPTKYYKSLAFKVAKIIDVVFVSSDVDYSFDDTFRHSSFLVKFETGEGEIIQGQFLHII